MHGFALNVNTDISYFDRIIPCGIFHKGVVSLQQIIGRHIELSEVHERLTNHFCTIFNVRIKQISREELESMLPTKEAIEENL